MRISDWSSDVCSSDLDIAPVLLMAVVAVFVCTAVVGIALSFFAPVGLVACLLLGAIVASTDPAVVIGIFRDLGAPRRLAILVDEIGSASCRERGCQYV